MVVWSLENAAVVQLWYNFDLLPCRFTLSAVNGRNLRAMGFVVVALELDKMVVRHPIVVVRDISVEFMIGHDILQKCACVKGLANRALHIGQKYVESKRERNEEFEIYASHLSESVLKRRLGEALANCGSPEGNKKFAELMRKFSDSLKRDGEELGTTGVIRHRIDTEEAEPIRLASKAVPVHYQLEIKDVVDDMLKNNVIQPLQSPWAAPIVLVRKKDNKFRLCVDY